MRRSARPLGPRGVMIAPAPAHGGGLERLGEAAETFDREAADASARATFCWCVVVLVCATVHALLGATGSISECPWHMYLVEWFIVVGVLYLQLRVSRGGGVCMPAAAVCGCCIATLTGTVPRPAPRCGPGRVCGLSRLRCVACSARVSSTCLHVQACASASSSRPGVQLGSRWGQRRLRAHLRGARV